MQTAISDGVVTPRAPFVQGIDIRGLTDHHRHALSRPYASTSSDDATRAGG